MKKFILMLVLLSSVSFVPAGYSEQTQSSTAQTSSGYEFVGSKTNGKILICYYELIVNGQVINTQAVTLYNDVVIGCPTKQ